MLFDASSLIRLNEGKYAGTRKDKIFFLIVAAFELTSKYIVYLLENLTNDVSNILEIDVA